MTSRIHRRLLSLASIALVALLTSCREEAAPTPLAPTVHLDLLSDVTSILTQPVSALIGPLGGTLRLGGGHAVVFPAGALLQPVLITATPLADGRVGIDFGPDGLDFPLLLRPVVVFNYAAAGISDEAARKLRIVYVKDGRIVEVRPTTIDTARDEARALIDHFSTYALATG